jgi:ABC-type multidrug transport system fused ATPase/permease subunit
MAADTVLVLDAGRIVERGPPAHLLAHRPDGPFAQLVRTQRVLQP